jgi:hypothetical protein
MLNVPPIDQVLPVLLWNVLLPALVAAALMVLAVTLAKWHTALAPLGSVLAIAAAVIFASRITDDRLPWAPLATGWQWLLWTTLAALTTDAVARLPRVPLGIGWALRGMVSAHAGWLVTPAGMREEFFWAPFLLAAVVLAEWALLSELERLDTRGLVALVLTPAALATAVVLIYAASARFGDLAMVLMAALAAVGIVALVFGRETNGVAAAVAILLPGLLLSGQYDCFDAVPAKCFALAALSPLMLAPSLWPAWRRYQKKGLWAVQLLLLLIPLAFALQLAAETGSLAYD